MGLDWIPGARALPGEESKFDELLSQIKVSSGAELDRLNDQLDLISSYKFDVLSIPVVGKDIAADEYMKQIYQEGSFDEPFEAWLLDKRGAFVLDLAEPCDGLPKFSNAGLYEDVDITSFRANLLKDCVAIIGRELLDKAFEMMTAAELCLYGEALEKKALAFANAEGIDVAKIDWAAENKQKPLEQLDIVLCASRYCRFWGTHGYYMHAWF
ncbi:MAG: hypothetical protein SFV17_04885 [Candidatus Obscuribacter sp.]|nr:hypothetical protein [Candidatus Melainabacteria bacterium]MDX1986005.1 hypothetical protein [Candidatus Obscuribacter sp.]